MVDPPPSPSSESDSTERIFLDWLELRERADAPTFDELCARYPEASARLVQLHAAHAEANAIFARLVRPVNPVTNSFSVPFTWSDPNGPPRYELKGEIARGGMGTIFEIFDPSLRRIVAMKVLSDHRGRPAQASDTDLARRQSRLLSEAQILAQLDHPGVVAIHEMGLDEHGQPYFTMKRVRGQDFGTVIRAFHAGDAEWRLARLIEILVRVCEAVAYAHQKGVIHRDLKPANVLVGRFGEVFVMDWGLAKATGRADAPAVPLVHSRFGHDSATKGSSVDSDDRNSLPSLSLVRTDRDQESSSSGSTPLATMAGEVVGTPPYMPPEQARGDHEAIDTRVDVYAAGAILYHILSGRHPYAGMGHKSGADILWCVLNGPPPPLSRAGNRVPEELAAICGKAMARDPAQRYATMLDFANELRAFLDGRVVRAHRTGAFIELRKWIGRNRWVAATIGIGILALVGVATVQMVMKEEIEQRAEALRARNYTNAVALAADAWRDGKIDRMAMQLEQAPTDLRGFEWRFLTAQLDTSDRVVPLPRETVAGPVPTPDGRHLITISRKDPDLTTQICLWNARSGEFEDEVDSFRLSGPVSAPSISADGLQLAMAVRDAEIRFWDMETNSRLPSIHTQPQGLYPGTCFSPDGVLLAASGSGPIELWDVRTRELVARLPLSAPRCAVCFSPDGARLYASTNDGAVVVFDVAKREVIAHLDIYEKGQGWGWGPPIAPSPDGRWFATGGLDKRFMVFDACSLRLVHLQVLGSPANPFWNSDSTLLAVADGPVVRLLEAGSWLERARLVGHRQAVNLVVFDDVNHRIVTAADDSTLRFWNMLRPDRWPSLSGFRLNHFPPRWTRDGRVMCVNTVHNDGFEFWSVETQQLLRTLRVGERLGQFDMSFDGTRVAVDVSSSGLIVVDVVTGSVLGTLPGVGIDGGHFNPDALRFSPDGTKISVVEREGWLSLWDAATRERIWRVRAYEGDYRWPFRVGGGAWSLDGKRIATVTVDARAEIWDADSGRQLAAWALGIPGMQRALFLADGKHVVFTGSWAVGMECWTVDGRTCTWSLPKEKVQSFALSSDGERLLCVGAHNALDVRDSMTGALFVSLPLDPVLDNGMSASPADDTIATSSAQGLRIWATRPPRTPAAAPESGPSPR